MLELDEGRFSEKSGNHIIMNSVEYHRFSRVWIYPLWL